MPLPESLETLQKARSAGVTKVAVAVSFAELFMWHASLAIDGKEHRLPEVTKQLKAALDDLGL